MIRTAGDVIEEFRLRGISVAAWARHNGFNPTLVYQVLRSRNIPSRGKSHCIAVALGLKQGLLEQDFSLMNQQQATH